MKKIVLLSALMTCSTLYAVEGPTNIILINLDDVGFGDFSCNGAYGYTTPNIDALASQGVRFTHFLACQPISGASRAGLLTGCYPNRIGFAGAPGPDSNYGIHPEEMTMGELMKQKGYSTAIFGKWHLGDAHQFLPLQNGFDEYYGLPYSNDMWPNHPQQGEVFNFPDLPTYDGNEVVGYNTVTIRTRAVSRPIIPSARCGLSVTTGRNPSSFIWRIPCRMSRWLSRTSSRARASRACLVM